MNREWGQGTSKKGAPSPERSYTQRQVNGSSGCKTVRWASVPGGEGGCGGGWAGLCCLSLGLPISFLSLLKQSLAPGLQGREE